jgi:hypothetical protein
MFRRSYSHKVVHVDATKACVALLILNLGTRREVGGQVHAWTALLPEKNPIKIGWIGPIAGTDDSKKRKISFPLPGFETWTLQPAA